MTGAVMRSDDAELLQSGPEAALRLLLDADDTRGALSVHRVLLRTGAEGATPHVHGRSSELFFILDGAADVLAGGEVHRLGAGDLAVVPSGTAHAFGAARGHDAELLIVLTPGVARFEFFRRVARVRAGEAPPSVLTDPDHDWDMTRASSTRWEQARAVTTGGTL